MNEVAENIKQRRLELQMSQEDLAKRIGLVNRASICDIETGRVGVSGNRLVKLAQALSCEPDDLDPDYLPIDKRYLPLIKAYAAFDVDMRKAICTILRIDYIKPRDHLD